MAALLLCGAIVLPACADRADNDRRDDTRKDSPTTAQRPSSTGVPDESTTSSTEPGDGGLSDDGPSTTVSGAQPGRPQLDAEPDQTTPG